MKSAERPASRERWQTRSVHQGRRRRWVGSALAAASTAVVVAVAAVVTNLATSSPPAALAWLLVGEREWWVLGGLVALSAALAAVAARISENSPGPEPVSQRQSQVVTVQIGQAAPEPVRPRPGQVVVGDLPAQPPSFVDRVAVDELRAAFRPGTGGVAVVCALTGGRGVGKTQTAAAFARERIAQGCPVVGWVSGESAAQLWAGLAELADRLGAADPEGDSHRSAVRLREHLQDRKSVV